jgi:uncharacterized oligopeptide transporter (OPT) family protein
VNWRAENRIVAATDQSGAVELTRRAILTGVVIGAALTPCNVYSGLKIGWSFNMSIAAGLLGAGLWRLAHGMGGARPFGLLENNINQTAASSAASIVSGGLVAPIPALTLLTGQTLGWPALAFWVFAVSALGIVVAAGLRRQMILREGLRFPAGVATAETLTRIHARGAEAAARLRLLLVGAVLSGAAKFAVELGLGAARFAPPVTLRTGGAGAASFHNLGLAFDPSLLMIGFGAIVGLRAGVSMLLGAALAWGAIAPELLARGWAEPGAPGAVWFGPLIAWLLWPGATLLVVSALVSLGVSLVRRRRGRRDGAKDEVGDGGGPSRAVFLAALAAASALAVSASVLLFGLGVGEAVLAVALSFVLAAVAARVTGETGITPVGALGKITQLTFGAVSPGQVASNLMAANITGGAAGQCADLMDDLKCGRIVGATARHQMVAQVFGVATGSLVGSAVYLALIPDPRAMLITPEWPAPAVATWKAVAEVLSQGFHAIPEGAVPAMGIAAALGILLGLGERLLPSRWARLLPSAPAVGLAFVIPAWNAVSLFIGAALAALAARLAPERAERSTVPLAAGLVAGESLVGVGFALAGLLR